MMYVALRETFDVYPGNKAVRRFAGEKLETFSTWPVQNQLAALSARVVREVPDDAAVEGMFGRQDRAEIELSKQHALSDAGALLATPVSTNVGQEVAVELPEHACSMCDFVGATGRGLAIHKGTAHKAP